MSALAEALLAAQRQAIAALNKALVADRISAESWFASLDLIGLRDSVDQGSLYQSLNIVKTFGADVPHAAGAANGTPREAKPASEAQWKLLRRLADERNAVAPDGPLTVEQASKVIEQLKAGTYNADEYTAPF